jgi:protein gp37
MSNIEWTQKTWNPIAGCSKVSPGCANCYAEVMAGRLAAMGQTKYQGLTVLQGKHRRWTGKIAFDRHALYEPIRRTKPTTYFVNSMSDLFHEEVTEDQLNEIFTVMAVCHQHTFQVLTKRPDFAEEYLSASMRLEEIYCNWTSFSGGPAEVECWPLPNVHIGVSIENANVKHRIDALRGIPAALRFLSIEPLIADVGELNLYHIDWVIVGGESGHGSRPCNVQWIRNVVRQCREQNVPVFVKQMGAVPIAAACRQLHHEWGEGKFSYYPDAKSSDFWRIKLKHRKGANISEWPEDLRVRQMPEVTPCL